MNKFLEIHKLPKLTQEDTENFNRPKEIASAIKKLSKRKSQDQMVSLVDSTKDLKKNEHQSYSKSSKN